MPLCNARQDCPADRSSNVSYTRTTQRHHCAQDFLLLAAVAGDDSMATTVAGDDSVLPNPTDADAQLTDFGLPPELRPPTRPTPSHEMEGS